jgi:hypothetical protein
LIGEPQRTALEALAADELAHRFADGRTEDAMEVVLAEMSDAGDFGQSQRIV